MEKFMNKLAILFITFEQACILKNHYQKQDENIPSSVQAVIDKSESVCE